MRRKKQGGKQRGRCEERGGRKGDVRGGREDVSRGEIEREV